jgi:hypothetical protein
MNHTPGPWHDADQALFHPDHDPAGITAFLEVKRGATDKPLRMCRC